MRTRRTGTRRVPVPGMSEYVVERTGSGGYLVRLDRERLSYVSTRLGARWVIWRHRRGKGPGTVVHREPA